MKLCMVLLLAAAVHAQAPPSFEVASLKPVQLTPGLYRANLGTARQGKVTLTNVTLGECLKFAFGITNDAQISGPAWIRSKEVRFDIEAKAPPDTPVPQLLLMLQTLLAERFQMALHREPRELSYLALVVGKKGPKLDQAKEGSNASGNSLGPGRIVSNRLSMQVLATLLSRFTRQTVLDMTELKGTFAVKLEWTPEPPRMPAPADGTEPREAPDPSAGVSLFTAVQQQLGLKLEARKGPLEVIVVERALKVPIEN